jgi:hypothetical protein
MSDDAFISNIDKALTTLVWNGIKNKPTIQNILSSQEQISFSPPKTSKTQKLSIYLYNIIEDPATRNQPTALNPTEKKKAQSSFALHYLIVPTAGSEENNHALLEKIIQTLSETPVIASAASGNGSELTVKLDSLSLDDLGKLWVALGVPFRLSVSVTVSSAKTTYGAQTGTQITTTTISTPVADYKNVTELYQAVFKTFIQQVGSKRRNFFQKQYTAQDFKKNTDMSIEEMQAALDSLGNKLELHISTAQYIKPLTALAEYYEHQLNQLKGFEKISPKQKENTEMINNWIKDVKALVAALSS